MRRALSGSSGDGVVVIREDLAVALRRAATSTVIVAAGILALSAVSGRIPRNPEGDWFRQVEVPAQVTLLAVVTAGALAGARAPGAGAVVVAVSGLALAVVSAIAHPPIVALVVASVFVVPSIAFWVAWQRRETSARIAALAGVTLVLLAASWSAASAVYDHYFGPAHPVSATAPLEDPLIRWAWAGAVDETGFTVVVRPRDSDARSVSMVVARQGSPDTGQRSSLTVRGPVIDGVARLRVDELQPDQRYRYAFTVDDVPAPLWIGDIATATPPDRAERVQIIFSSCARTGSNGVVFDRIRSMDPDLYVITGDLHYENIARDDFDAFARAYDRVLDSPAQAALYRNTPVAYVWDDHDYGPNDGDASSPSRLAALAAYRRSVPHHDLELVDTISQAFSHDGIRLILLDTRSARVPGETLLGDAQLNWMLDELVDSSATHDLVVVVSPTPWIGDADAAADTWAGFDDERRAIADHIAEHDLDDVVMVGGDAHMVAIDDGSHSDYSADGHHPMPVLQAAALDRPGGVKGGPYSEGAFPGAGQFGSVTVERTERLVSVVLAGHRHDGEVLVSYGFEIAADATRR